MRRFSLCAGLLALALGCGGGAAKVGPTKWANSATLSGDPVGLGTEPVDKLTRTLPADVSGAGVTGTMAILASTSTTSSSYRFIVPVTNHSTRRQCFLVTETFELLDAAGVVLSTHSEEWVTGSTGKLKDNSMCTDSCLDVGESGYLLGLSDGTPLESIASLHITLSASTSEWGVPPTSIVPIAYSAPDRNKAYTVTVANQGTVAASVSDISSALFFDDTGMPVYWDLLLSGTITGMSPHTMAPGGTYVLNSVGDSTQWTGNSTQLWVAVDFNLYTSAPDQRLAPNDDLQVATALQTRRSALRQILAASGQCLH